MVHSTMSKKNTLKEAVKFHGHLGPYLVLGLLAGQTALKKLSCEKYFGVKVRVWGANEKPKSCLIDGLQLSTGATYGKGNIEKLNGSAIKINFYCLEKKQRLNIELTSNLAKRLQAAKTHAHCEALAKKLLKEDCRNIFNLSPIT